MVFGEPFDGCNYTETALKAGRAYARFIYYGCVPTLFIFAFIGHIITLISFYKQSKIEQAYLYQIFLAIIQTVECVDFVFYIIFRVWFSGVAHWGEEWFMRCWFCMWLDAHIFNPMQSACFYMTTFMSICMTLDRIYALAFPIRYNKIKHRRVIQWFIFVIVVTSALAAIWPNVIYFNTNWIEEENLYRNKGTNKELRPLLNKFINIANFVSTSGIIMLVICDVIMIALYQYRMKKKFAWFTNPEQMAVEMQKMKTLVWLTFIQATLDIAMAGAVFLYQIFSDDDCVSEITGPFVDFVHTLTNTLDFYISFALVKSFRAMVQSAMKGLFRKGVSESSVTPIAVAPGNQLQT